MENIKIDSKTQADFQIQSKIDDFLNNGGVFVGYVSEKGHALIIHFFILPISNQTVKFFWKSRKSAFLPIQEGENVPQNPKYYRSISRFPYRNRKSRMNSSGGSLTWGKEAKAHCLRR